MIDLSKLPAPSVIDELSFETIRNEILDNLTTYDPELVNLPPSDSSYKLLEVVAYRELLLRQRDNDRAKSMLLAHAKNADLDHIGVTYFLVERLVIDAGNENAIPPVAPTYESDDAYRYRLLISPDGYSTAGPDSAYEYHALSADGSVKDIDVASPAPVSVVITVLSHVGDGVPDAALISIVDVALNDDKRPFTDQVTVQAATVTSFTINATLVIYPGLDQETIRLAAFDSLTAWVVKYHKLGFDITVVGVTSALKVEGVKDVTLNNTVSTDLTANLVRNNNEAGFCSGITVDVGSIDE